MTEVDITAIRSLVEAEAKANAMLRKLKSEQDKMTRVRDQIRAQIARVMGDNEVGLVDGAAVLKRTQSSQFATAKFRDENPDLYDMVKTFEMTEKVDKDKLAQVAPEVYGKYLTWRWTNGLEFTDV